MKVPSGGACGRTLGRDAERLIVHPAIAMYRITPATVDSRNGPSVQLSPKPDDPRFRAVRLSAAVHAPNWPDGQDSGVKGATPAR